MRCSAAWMCGACWGQHSKGRQFCGQRAVHRYLLMHRRRLPWRGCALLLLLLLDGWQMVSARA